jgi:hypothetical protein
MKKGLCAICGTIKTQFGGSILNTALNALPLPEMHLRSRSGAEQVPGGSFNDTGKYSFCGPFTKLQKRISQGYRGVNTLDQACLGHDIAYSKHKDTPTRNKYDDILSAGAAKIAVDERTPEYEKQDARLVNAIIAAKSRFGLGFKNKYA